MTSAIALAPLLVLLAGSPATFLLARRLRPRGAAAAGLSAFGFFLLSFGLAAILGATGAEGRIPFLGTSTLEADGLAIFLALVTTGLGMAVSLYSIGSLADGPGVERYYPLLLLMSAGAVGIGFAADLFALFVFFELTAIASFGLVAYETHRPEALEAGLKYVAMSGAGSLTALFGISLVYLGTGTLDLAAIRASPAMPASLGAAAAALLIAGFGLKAALVPVHTWLPDAHAAAPSGISAMLSGVVIEAALVALAKGIAGVNASTASLGAVLGALAVLTMTVGNLLALPQTDLKRMLAFSSVSQVGYILLGFALAIEFGVVSGLQGGLFHLLTHAVAKGGAFLGAGAFLWIAGTRDLERLAGVGRAAPALGLSFAVFALGLAGVPPMSGFLSKLLIAKAGLDAGGTVPLVLVVALAANSVLSLGYYVPALLRIGFAESDRPRVRVPWAVQVPVVGLAAASVLMGLFPDPFLAVAGRAADALAGLLGGA
jgi:proton-translocating NADH-quinone oxidoreductase chain N